MNQSTDHLSSTWLLVFSSWLIATFATLASLFFSEVMGLTPCVLCWYQRILIFPLTIILFVGLFPLDRRVIQYALPFSLLGIAFTLYHCLLFFDFIPASLQPCSQGIPCNDDSMVLFGVIPIPLLALIAFVSISCLLFFARTRKST